jgi:hypothetical protein
MITRGFYFTRNLNKTTYMTHVKTYIDRGLRMTCLLPLVVNVQQRAGFEKHAGCGKVSKPCHHNGYPNDGAILRDYDC